MKSGVVKFDAMDVSWQMMVKNKLNDQVKSISDLMMNKYDTFSNELQSDIALGVILCSRIIIGIKHDLTSLQTLI